MKKQYGVRFTDKEGKTYNRFVGTLEDAEDYAKVMRGNEPYYTDVHIVSREVTDWKVEE